MEKVTEIDKLEIKQTLERIAIDTKLNHEVTEIARGAAYIELEHVKRLVNYNTSSLKDIVSSLTTMLCIERMKSAELLRRLTDETYKHKECQ